MAQLVVSVRMASPWRLAVIEISENHKNRKVSEAGWPKLDSITNLVILAISENSDDCQVP